MQPRMRVSTTVLGAPDAPALAAFYRRLLGWDTVVEEPYWVTIRPPDGGSGLSFQYEPLHTPPVWPAEADHQQMTAHLDIAVEDLLAGVDWAVEAGARLAAFQPQKGVKVMLDPAGNPFCLFTAQV